MSAASIAARPSNVLVFERRSRQRFPLSLEIEFRTYGKAGQFGLGQTLNISSSGLLFQTADARMLSGSIVVLVNWPYLLDGFCALKLVMKGRIVRRQGGTFAVHSKHHEFRTSGAFRARLAGV